MSASPLFRLTFADGDSVERRGNYPVWRLRLTSQGWVCLAVRDVQAGDMVSLDSAAQHWRRVKSVERLPPRTRRKTP